LTAEVSEARGEPAQDGVSDEAMALIGDAVGHLGRTVEYLLSLARQSAGTDVAHVEARYLDDVVSGVVARLTRIADARGVRIRWGRLEETFVCVDPHMADQVAQIVLENAIQYCGGTVTVSVHPDARGAGQFAVEDDGPGVDPTEFETLFTPFVRGAAARVTGAAGSGLGLAVARWMVEACAGRIWVEQASPHGARFVIQFPPAR